MMIELPNLTTEQKKTLAVLEPQLRLCIKSANLEKAKKITFQIQEILRPTGHETRLLQAKNWLYETAMEANSFHFAIMGFEGTRKKSSPSTRLHLEATALLSICYLREGNLPKARQLVSQSVQSISSIKSIERRKQFHKRFLQRLEEESILSGLIDKTSKPLDIDEVNDQAVLLIKTKSEEEILTEMGKAVPKNSLNLLEEIREAYQLRLPASDRQCLPAPLTEKSKEELGKRASSALKRVAWRALCNPKSEIYKAWNQGLSIVYDKKYIATAIATTFGSYSITATMIAASAVALAFKFGAEVFCETFAPESLMIDKKDKK
ncbi:hypothetical protein ACLBNB_19230 [Pseudomonas chlororaphis subsp. aurantiaca]|uniref:hypothetical protein n=1 Tax=Pseudomonas chlororaphis TaxID=587753 RepID=UPI00398B877A